MLLFVVFFSPLPLFNSKPSIILGAFSMRRLQQALARGCPRLPKGSEPVSHQCAAHGLPLRRHAPSVRRVRRFAAQHSRKAVVFGCHFAAGNIFCRASCETDARANAAARLRQRQPAAQTRFGCELQSRGLVVRGRNALSRQPVVFFRRKRHSLSRPSPDPAKDEAALQQTNIIVEEYAL